MDASLALCSVDYYPEQVDWKSLLIYEGKINSLIPVSYTQVRFQLIQGLKF
jgi:hypothetical protein